MRRNAHIVRAEATVQPQRSLLPNDLLEAIDHPLVRQPPIRTPLLLLQARLDKVKRQAEERSKEAGRRRGRQSLHARAQTGVLKLVLCFREESQLAEVQRHGADHRRVGAAPQRADALAARDADQRVEDAAVVGALLSRLQAVRLHTDERQVGRVAEHGGDTSSRQTGGRALGEADLFALPFGAGGELLHERLEEAHSRGGVDGLSEEAGRQAGVEVHDAAGGYDLAGDAQGSGLGAGLDALAGQLQADFDHVNGLDDGRGDHAGGSAVDEGQGCAHQRRAESFLCGLLGVFFGFLQRRGRLCGDIFGLFDCGLGVPLGRFHCGTHLV